MTKAKKLISTFKDLPIEKPVEFIGLIDSKYGGLRWKRDERSQTWEFVATLVAWQADGGLVLHEQLWVSKKDLDNSDAVALVRQTPKGRMIQFTGRRPRRLGTSRNYVKLVGPILKTRERFAVEPTAEKPKPKPYTDKIFGRLRFNEESGGFECEKTFGNSKLTITFETDDLEKLKAMLPVASRLWGKRDKWFKQWQNKAYRYYVDRLVDAWWQGEEKLTRSLFIKHLGWPCGLDFSIEDDVVRYCLTGLSDELYGDHGLDGTGATLSDMEISFA